MTRAEAIAVAIAQILPLVISAAALLVSIYNVRSGPRRSTLYSERVKLSAKMLQSSADYGWLLGSYVHVPDRAPFTNAELHDPAGAADDVFKRFNALDADLISMDIIMPDDWRPAINDCRARLTEAQNAFQAGAFSELKEKFHAFHTALTELRQKLRAFLH
jgi:hypothetical protein